MACIQTPPKTKLPCGSSTKPPDTFAINPFISFASVSMTKHYAESDCESKRVLGNIILNGVGIWNEMCDWTCHDFTTHRNTTAATSIGTRMAQPSRLATQSRAAAADPPPGQIGAAAPRGSPTPAPRAAGNLIRKFCANFTPPYQNHSKIFKFLN